MTGDLWPWAGILLLGVWHGINPGMGWLFAVALGLQERSARAVWRALPPLALGHALAVAQAVLVAAALGMVLPPDTLKWIVAGSLVAFALWRLWRNGHPRYGGMRVGSRDLTIWSLLMATAHGAGLMVVPFVMRVAPAARDASEAWGTDSVAGHAHHGAHMAAMAAPAGDLLPALAAAAVHTAGYLLVTGLIAVLVYQRLGLKRLRELWVNLDVIWGVALLATAAVTLLI